MIQGFGMGFIFVPLSTLAFATLSPSFRADGSSMFALVRNMGQGVGISVVTAVLSNMNRVNHVEVGERLTSTSWAVLNQLPILLTGNKEYLDLIDQYVQQQGAMISYLDDFVLMMLLSVAAAPIILLLRGNKAKAAPSAKPKTAEEKALERAHAMAE